MLGDIKCNTNNWIAHMKLPTFQNQPRQQQGMGRQRQNHKDLQQTEIYRNRSQELNLVCVYYYNEKLCLPERHLG
jgi:hypothetical protein